MKKRINLLTKHEDYQRWEKIFSWIRLSTILSVIIFFITTLGLIFLLFENKKGIDELIKKKENLLKFISQHAPTEAKYQIFSKKFDYLKKILDQDVNFFPYYQLINQSLQSATTGAILKSITISKDKKTNFEVGFTTFEEMINFLNTVESSQFTQNFQSLSLKNFSLKQELETNKKEFLLNFEGQFKKTNED